jgi:hypothetical protein
MNQGFGIHLPNDPAISAVAFDPLTHATFKRIFERSQLKAFAEEVVTYADYCLLLTNRSIRRITALTLVWEYAHPIVTHPPLNVRRSDSYYFGENSRGVIPAHSKALIHPKRTIPEAVLDHEGDLLFASSDGNWGGLRDIDIMRASPQVTVTFDTVIFDDGRVLGGDASRTVEFITNRKKAASEIVALIRRGQEDGSDIDGVLLKVHEETGNAREDSYAFWLRAFARQLRRVPADDRDVSLTQYAALPDLPEFKKQPDT